MLRCSSSARSAPADEGDHDVEVGAVEPLAPVVVHRRRPGIGMTGGELDITEGRRVPVSSCENTPGSSRSGGGRHG